MPGLTANHPALYARPWNRRSGQRAPLGGPEMRTEPNQPKETIMFRTAIILIALTATAAQAEPVTDRIQHAAQAACAVERATGSQPSVHYGAIYQECVHRLSSQATARLAARTAGTGMVASK